MSSKTKSRRPAVSTCTRAETQIPPGFEPRRNIDAIPENIAILDDDISDIDANAELDPIVARNRRIALGHCRLHFDRAAQRVDDAGELNQQTVAHHLDDPAMMLGNLGIRHLGADCPEPFQGSALVDADQPQIAGDIGREDRREPTLNADRPRGLDGASSVSDDPIPTRAGPSKPRPFCCYLSTQVCRFRCSEPLSYVVILATHFRLSY
jgi:hypothetical protein